MRSQRIEVCLINRFGNTNVCPKSHEGRILLQDTVSGFSLLALLNGIDVFFFFLKQDYAKYS